MSTQANTQNIYTQERLPAWVQPYYTQLADWAQQEAQTGYTPYQDQRIAGFTAPEMQAFGSINQYAMQGGSPYWSQALGMMPGALNQMQGIAGLYPGLTSGAFNTANQYSGQFGQQGALGQQVGTQAAHHMLGTGQGMYQTGQQNLPMTTQADWSQYMAPYDQYVTNPVIREIEQSGRRQLTELGGQAANAGAFGGARHGLLEQGVMQDTRQQIEDARNKAATQAYERGIGMFESDRAARQQNIMNQMGGLQGLLGAQQAAYGAQMGGLGFNADMLGQGLGSQQWGYGYGQTGLGQQANVLQNYMGGIGQLGGMGAQDQQLFFDRMAAQQRSGEAVRGLQQAMLDTGYQDFMRQQQYPRDSLSWFSSILNAFPHQSMGSTTQSTAVQQPGLFQTMFGTGIGGIGLYNALQGGYGGSQ